MKEDREGHKEFEAALQQDLLTNAVIRVAKDLERVLMGIMACAGFLGVIVFILLVRWMTGH